MDPRKGKHYEKNEAQGLAVDGQITRTSSTVFFSSFRKILRAPRDEYPRGGLRNGHPQGFIE
jgi:hypothetical protein